MRIRAKGRMLVLALVVGCSGAADPERPTAPVPEGKTASADPAPEAAGEGAEISDTRGLKRVVESEGAAPGPGMDFRVRAKAGGEIRPVVPGDTLRSGDRIELFVNVDRDAFVYVVQFFSDGTSAVLFPDHGDVQLIAGAAHRLPAAKGGWLELDDAVGEEHIYVIASIRPLTELEAELGQVLDSIRTSASGAVPAKPKTSRRKLPPEERRLLDMSNRSSSVLSPDRRAMVVEAPANSEGVSVGRFWFHHK